MKKRISLSTEEQKVLKHLCQFEITELTGTTPIADWHADQIKEDLKVLKQLKAKL